MQHPFSDDGSLIMNQDDILDVVSDSEEANVGGYVDTDLECRTGQALFMHNKVVKSINNQIYNLHGDGEDMFRLLISSSDISREINAPDEPSHSKAVNSNEKVEWLKAMSDEIKGCIDRGTFEFVPRNLVDKGAQSLSAKWVLKKKYKSNMELDKFKARIVARGFSQKKGIDFNETTASTARSASWRILMALAAINGWYVLQADFIAAYLAGDLKEVIYMDQFPELERYFAANPRLRKSMGHSKDCKIRLRKPLYGLKQAGACWQEKIRKIMQRHGFVPLAADDAIYFNRETDIIVGSYVDDFLLIGPDRKKLQELMELLDSEVPLNDLGEASWFLGIRIHRPTTTGSVRLDQRQYIERSINELEQTSIRAVPTPMSVASRADMKRYTGKTSGTELYNYQKLIGNYNFSACMTRCDTSQALSQLARYMCNPSPQHYQHLMRVVRYLSGTSNRGFIYEKEHRHKEDFGKYGLHCAVDASFADDWDSAKSTTGYIIFMAGSPVIWRSKLQSTVTTLTCEAEYAALFEATKDCAWIRTFLEEIDQMPPGSIPVLEDNSGTIKWATTTGVSSGRRHVRVEYKYTVQKVRQGNIDVKKIETKLNPADGFTKPLDSASFEDFVRRLGMVDQ